MRKLTNIINIIRKKQTDEISNELIKVKFLPRKFVEEFIREEFHADEIFYINNIGSFSEMNKQFKNVKMIVNVNDKYTQEFTNGKLEV